MISLGSILKGRVTAVNYDPDNNQLEGLQLTLYDHEGSTFIGLIPINDLDDPSIPEGESGRRHIARKYLGRLMIAKVVKENPLILSHSQAIIEKAKEISLEPGQEIEGKVIWATKNVAALEYLDCIQMLMTAEEYGPIRHVDLRKALTPGATIKVEVTSIEDGVVFCSHKKFMPNPWPRIQQKYKKKNQYLCAVTRLLTKGVIVELERGLEVLATPYPFFDVKVGDEVGVEITDINPEAGKIRGFITAKAASADTPLGRISRGGERRNTFV